MKEYIINIYDTFYILKDQAGKEVHREDIHPPTYTPDNPTKMGFKHDHEIESGCIYAPFELFTNKSKVKTVYQTNENKIFQDKSSADRHSARLDLIAFLSKHSLNETLHGESVGSQTTSTMESILTLLDSIPATGLKELALIIVRLK